MPTRSQNAMQILEAVNGSPQFLGVIVATTTINNHTTAAPFNNTGDALKAKCLLLQPDTDCYFLAGTTNAATVTTANGVKLSADEKVILTLKSGEGWLACLAVTGTTNLKVWELV